jgi:hypothetical protein
MRGRGLRAAGPYPLFHTPSPNPLFDAEVDLLEE